MVGEEEVRGEVRWGEVRSRLIAKGHPGLRIQIWGRCVGRPVYSRGGGRMCGTHRAKPLLEVKT